MSIRSSVARSLSGCILLAAVGAASVPALAQHVVTDGEASKLTLDALTAAPRFVVHRAAYRPVRMSWSEGWSRERGHDRSVGMLREASFRRGFLHEASFRHSIRATGMTVHPGLASHHRRRS